MDIDPDIARKALDEIQATRVRMRRALEVWGGAYHFLVWGAIWAVGFMLSYFQDRLPPHFSNWSWGALNLIGNAASLSIGFRQRKTFRLSRSSGLGPIWILFLCFGAAGGILSAR